MAYTPFKIPVSAIGPATLATLATVHDRTPPSVANVANVAGQTRETDAPKRQTVANVASVAAGKAKNENRRDWWNAPVEGWPERLSIRNIVTDETRTIRLRGRA